MRGFALGLTISIAFVLGCVSAPLIVPDAVAQPAPEGLQQWEYACTRPRGSYQEKIAELNARGRQGWELVGIASYGNLNEEITYCFKRPM